MGLINDADFTYPKDFEKETLRDTINKYKLRNKCNLKYLKLPIGEDSILVAKRDIKKSEELTKRYGLAKWGCG